MGNYCRGTATLSGDRATLDLIYVLCQRLGDCAAVSGFDADEEWLPHIFTTEVTEEGVFCEDCGLKGDALELCIKVSRGTGCEFFEDMANALSLSIVWKFVSDWDDEQYVYTYTPARETTLRWALRSEESLDEEDEGDTLKSHEGGGISSMRLGAMSDASPRPTFNVPTQATSTYTYCAETVECLGNLKSLLQEYHTAFIRSANFRTATSCEGLMQLLTKMQLLGPGALMEALAQARDASMR